MKKAVKTEIVTHLHGSKVHQGFISLSESSDNGPDLSILAVLPLHLRRYQTMLPEFLFANNIAKRFLLRATV